MSDENLDGLGLGQVAEEMGDSLATTALAYETVAREGGAEAVGLLGALMEQSHRHTESTFQSLYEFEKADHERTKARLEDAYARLDKISHRLSWLLGETDEIVSRMWS